MKKQHIDAHIEIKVEKQGDPKVNQGFVIKAYPDLVAAHIDMKTKWCTIFCNVTHYGRKKSNRYIGLVLESPENSKVKNRFTEISFPQFQDWEIFNSNLNRYTLSITFIRRTGT
jgi:hypothetical protein